MSERKRRWVPGLIGAAGVAVLGAVLLIRLTSHLLVHFGRWGVVPARHPYWQAWAGDPVVWAPSVVVASLGGLLMFWRVYHR